MHFNSRTELKMKRFIASSLIVLQSMIFTGCSHYQVNFDNVTNNRSNGQNFCEGTYSYTDNCIYCKFEDGIYEYDISEGSALKIVDFANIAKDLTEQNSNFAYISDGIVVQARGEELDYDKNTGIATESFNLYVVNFKGDLKDTITLKYQTNENDPSQNEIHAIRGFYKFTIDNGWIYGSDRGSEMVRYNPLTEELQYLGSGFLCIAGDYIYFIDNNDGSLPENTISRIKESDLSGRETISLEYRPKDNKTIGDEIMNYISAYSDGTLVCRKEIYTQKDEKHNFDYWKGDKWYSFKFGEEPKVIGDGLSEFDEVFYARGDYYAFSVTDEENLGEEIAVTINVVKVDGNSFERKTIFNDRLTGKSRPMMIGEKFILLNHSEDNAVIYNIETGEIINCTK